MADQVHQNEPTVTAFVPPYGEAPQYQQPVPPQFQQMPPQYTQMPPQYEQVPPQYQQPTPQYAPAPGSTVNGDGYSPIDTTLADHSLIAMILFVAGFFFLTITWYIGWAMYGTKKASTSFTQSTYSMGRLCRGFGIASIVLSLIVALICALVFGIALSHF